MNIAFRRLVRALLLSAGPMSAVSCLTSEDPTEMPERAQCVDANGPERYTALTLAPGIDGIAFATRSMMPVSLPDGGVGMAEPELISSLGVPCARAIDRTACSQRVLELLTDPLAEGWTLTVGYGCFGCVNVVTDFGVITSGDEIRVATFADVLRAVSPIETRDEAAVALLLQGGGLDCNANNVRPESDGWTFKDTRRYCDGAVREFFWHVTHDAEVALDSTKRLEKGDNSCVEGRRPAHLAPSTEPWLSSLAACFAEIAHMEAAAVLAFDELDRQLRAFGAPFELLLRVARARADEIDHAARTSALARRFGGRPRAPRVEGAIDPHAPGAFYRFALENAVEGCVREAYGAVVAAYQASHASDAGVRETFARIARDEAEHAELSFALDAWLCTRLSPAERARIEAAKAQAWLDLELTCNVEPLPEVVRVAGMPTARMARALVRQLRFAVEDVAA